MLCTGKGVVEVEGVRDRDGEDKWVKMFGGVKACRGERVRKMGSGWIDEKKSCDRSCLVKVMRIRGRNACLQTDEC
jgi:hypothetical protein